LPTARGWPAGGAGAIEREADFRDAGLNPLHQGRGWL
jgi:hypothetical protein